MATLSQTSSGVPASTAWKPSRRRRTKINDVLRHAIIIFFCLVVLVPIAWVLLLSVKSIRDSVNGSLWPGQFDFTHYGYVFQKMPNVLTNFGNSIIVTLSTVAITSVIAILAGYVIVHLRLPGAAVISTVLIASLFFPTRLVSLIGIYNVQDDLGLLNTLPGLILPYVTLNLAISILIMKGMFEQISKEMMDAARMDGASSWRTLWDIMLPLVSNGIVVMVIVNFVTAWGEYLLAVTLTSDQSVRTLPVVLVTTFGGFGEWALPRTAAIYIMAITPGILTFAFAQRWYMKGLMEGALKF